MSAIAIRFSRYNYCYLLLALLFLKCTLFSYNGDGVPSKSTS